MVFLTKQLYYILKQTWKLSHVTLFCYNKIIMKQRTYYLDALRVISIFFVIVIHATSTYWAHLDPNTYSWNVLNVYNSISRFSVPVFCMISGALFLDHDRVVTVNRIITKYIPRLLVSLLLWNCFYSFVEFYFNGFDPVYFINTFLEGQIHFWFTYMIIGFYLIVPLLRNMLISNKDCVYFILLSAVVVFITPLLSRIEALKFISDIIGRLQINAVAGYTIYFVLGYYLKKNDFTKKKKYLIYMFGLLSLLFTVIASRIISINDGKPNSFYYSYLSLNVMLTSIAVFVLFKDVFNNNEYDYVTTRFLSISKYCFGIYQCHLFVLSTLTNIGYFDINSNFLITVPIISIVTMIISLVITFVISKIPVLKDWII